MKNKNKMITREMNIFLEQTLEEIRLCSSESDWISFPYGKDQMSQIDKDDVLTALIIWKFLRKFYQIFEYQNETSKRNFIAHFLANDPLALNNDYVQIVAMIEALPTSIWRKLLWRENIDFAGYESCIRRLSYEQRQAIIANYDDLFSSPEAHTPRVLKKSWRDRVKLFFGITSTEKIMDEEYDGYTRHQSKGAYAFSLLGLDFGFSLYPKGDNDDTKITNQKYTRFFSVKEHINDFIVNKEDGKYWWLYKSARSNYAYNYSSEVKMKTHVCPGFWLTLILQTIFWIISPLAIITDSIVIAKYGFTHTAFVLSIFTAPMVIWALLAIIHFLIDIFEDLTYGSKVAKFIGKVIGISVLVFFAGIGLYHICGFIWGLLIALIPVCGTVLSALFMLSSIFYIFFLLVCLMPSKPLFKYREIPSFLRFILHLSVGATLLVLFDKFWVDSVLNFMVLTAQSFWQWYTFDLLISNWILLTAVFVGLFTYFFLIFHDDEKRFVGFQKTFTWLTRGFVTFTIIVYAIIFIRAGNLYIADLGVTAVFALGFVFFCGALSFLMLNQVNVDTIGERTMASEFLFKINDRMNGLNNKSYITRIIKSPWLSPLNKEQRWEIIYKIQSLAFDFFNDDPGYRARFSDLMIMKGNLKIIDTLSLKRRDICDACWDDNESFFVVKHIVAGKTVEEALNILRDKKYRDQVYSDRLDKFGRTIVYPFVKIGKSVSWIWKQISQFFYTLKDLWDFFNKRCPFVSEPRHLD